MEANREESLMCLNMAYYYLRLEGNREKAKRLAIKSNQLFPTQLAQDLLNVLMGVTQPPATSSASAQPPQTKQPVVAKVSTSVNDLSYKTEYLVWIQIEKHGQRLFFGGNFFSKM